DHRRTPRCRTSSMASTSAHRGAASRSAVLRHASHPRMIAALIEWLLIVSVRLLAGGQARWQGCSPSPEQRIYVANHSSHLDVVLLLSTLPPPIRHRTRPVAAAEYWSAGPLRRYLIHNIFRGVLVERDRNRL